jgi:hypothetical protein
VAKWAAFHSSMQPKILPVQSWPRERSRKRPVVYAQT